VGDTVAEDEVVLEIETDKVGIYLNINILFLTHKQISSNVRIVLLERSILCILTMYYIKMG
jgi:hypothetical protein